MWAAVLSSGEIYENIYVFSSSSFYCFLLEMSRSQGTQELRETCNNNAVRGLLAPRCPWAIPGHYGNGPYRFTEKSWRKKQTTTTTPFLPLIVFF
jgi:hypothetical protein